MQPDAPPDAHMEEYCTKGPQGPTQGHICAIQSPPNAPGLTKVSLGPDAPDAPSDALTHLGAPLTRLGAPLTHLTHRRPLCHMQEYCAKGPQGPPQGHICAIQSPPDAPGSTKVSLGIPQGTLKECLRIPVRGLCHPGSAILGRPRIVLAPRIPRGTPQDSLRDP